MTPPFQAPDEDAHFAYTQQLVERHRVPTAAAPGPPLSTEFAVADTWGNLEPTRGVPDARTAWTPIEESSWRAAERKLAASARADGVGGNPAAQNPPLYYVYESVPYWLGLHTSDASFFTRLELMRLANIPLYLAAICFIWLLTVEVLGRRWCAAVAASVVVLQPKFGFISSGVSPDVALAAEWSAFLYVAVRIVTAGATHRRVSALAACGIAALLTQPRSAAVVAIALLALALAPRARFRVLPAAITVAILAAGTLAYLALVRAQSRPAWLTSPSSLHPWQFLSYLWQFYLPRLPGMDPMLGPDYGAGTAWVNRFFGDFGWLEIPFPHAVNTGLRLGSVVLLVLLAVGLVLEHDAVRRRWRVAALLLGAVLLELLVLHVAAFESMLTNPGDPILTGRYLFPLISIWGLAVATAVAILPRVVRTSAATGVVAAAALLDVLAFTVVIERFYA